MNKAALIQVPDRVTTLHTLAYFLLREYMEEEHYKYTTEGKFDVLFETANAYSIGLYRACSITAKEVIKRYDPQLNSKNRKQLIFIISKHLESALVKSKEY